MIVSGGPRVPAFSAWRLALAVVLLAALGLRLYGLNWDEGADLHPDELFIAKIVLIDRIHLNWPPDLRELFDPARSGLNPRSADPTSGQFREFAYGALPLFVTDFLAWMLSRITGTNWNAMDHAFLVGRTLSAILSALTILPIAALGSKVGGRAVGLLAALFAALTPMSVQLAHFFTTDSWLAFFVALTLLACVHAAGTGGTRWFALAGACFGLAMATKGSVFALAVPVGAGLVIAGLSRPEIVRLRSAARNACTATVSAIVAFLVFEPFALLRPDVYLRSMRTQADIVAGSFDVPFTRVYVGTTPVLYQLQQLLLWGYGPVAGVLAVGGLGLLLIRATRDRSAPELVLGSWTLAYSFVLLFADAKFLRYLEPLAPVFAVTAGLALVKAATLLSHSRWSRAAIPVTAGVLAMTALWSAAFLSIYAHENPRLAATKWIYAQVPAGATLTAEYWDDPLPRALSYALNPSTFGYGTVQLDLYRDLPPRKESAEIFGALRTADFIVQSSQRVESAIWAAPWRYPVQERFYDLLNQGQLWFAKTVSFAREPTIAGLTVDDATADESFVNYDHPRVTIYQRLAALPRSVYNDAMAWALQRPWSPSRQPASATLLLDRPVGQNPAVDDARWSAAVTSSTPAAIVVWVGLLVVLAVIGAPIAQIALGGFADRGWGFARLLALVIAGYAVWLGASLRLFAFRAIWVLLALAVVGAFGWTWQARRTSLPNALRAPYGNPWKHAEAAFWVVFALFLGYRLLNPDGWHPLWGGEKPMEFAQINAIGRSAYFPPYDPWFADGYINYYYYGFYLVAFLLKAVGMPAEVGFNLAQPTVMALLASAAFSLAAAISARLKPSTRLATVGGWLAVVVVCLMGNLSALRGLLAADRGVIDPFVYWTWNGSRAIDNAITEFPYFTGLYADLHAHVVALPLTLLVIALCFALVSDSFSRARLALLALTLGTLFVTNAWDVPVYAVLSVVSIFMASAGIPLRRRCGGVVALVSGAVVGGAWLLFLPFHRSYVALFSSLAPVRDPTDLPQFLTHFGGLLVICAFGLTLLMAPPRKEASTSTLAPFFPLFFLALASMLWRNGGSTIAANLLVCVGLAGGPVAATWLRTTERERSTALAARGVLIIASLTSLATVFFGRPVLGLLCALAGAASAGWLTASRPAVRFLCVLLAGGFFTAAGAEVIVVADDLINTTAYRMNTVFKFYNQVWVLLALSAACLVTLMIGELVPQAGRNLRDSPLAQSRVRWSSVGLAVSVLAILGGLLYPVVATGPRLAQRFDPGTQAGNLDALLWMDQGAVPTLEESLAGRLTYRGDLAAIRWLQDNVEGTPVIAEASIGPYRCNGSRISNATGLPTIIGWERHEQQQRYPEDLPSRVKDVRTLYTSTDLREKASILSRYNVEYVIVGDLERAYPLPDNACSPTGSAAGIAAFERMVGSTLEVAHAEAGTTIYRVLPASTAP